MVKFITEWIEKLETEQVGSSLPLAGLIQLTFERQFNSENSHEINLTLLEILPYYNKNDQLFNQVSSLTKHQNPMLKAQAIFTLSQVYAHARIDDVLALVLETSNDTNLSVMVRSS